MEDSALQDEGKDVTKDAVSEVSEASISLDRVTFESADDVELTQDHEMAETIQAALVEAVQPVMTEEASERPSPAVPDSPIPPPDSGEADSGVPAPRPDSSDNDEGIYVVASASADAFARIENQTDPVAGAVDVAEIANEIVEKIKDETAEEEAQKPTSEEDARKAPPPMEDLSIVAGVEAPVSDAISNVNQIEGPRSDSEHGPDQDGDLQISEDEIDFHEDGEISTAEPSGREIPGTHGNSTTEMTTASLGEVQGFEKDEELKSGAIEFTAIIAGEEGPQMKPIEGGASGSKVIILSGSESLFGNPPLKPPSSQAMITNQGGSEGEMVAGRITIGTDSDDVSTAGGALAEGDESAVSQESSQPMEDLSIVAGVEIPAGDISAPGESKSDLEIREENEPVRPDPSDFDLSTDEGKKQYDAAMEGYQNLYAAWQAKKPPDEGDDDDGGADSGSRDGETSSIPGGSVLSDATSGIENLKDSSGG